MRSRRGWPSLTVTPTIAPNKAGTPRHPQGVKLTAAFHWQTLGESSQPIVTSFLVKFPKGSLDEGAHYTTCSLSKAPPRAEE